MVYPSINDNEESLWKKLVRNTSEFSPSPPVETSTYQILITGQSLAVGSHSIPPVSITQPYENKMFAGGVRAPLGGLGSLIPLIETESFGGGETIASGMANELTRDNGNIYIVADHAGDGLRYIELKKGTAPYALGMAQAQAAFDLVPENFLGVIAVTTLHGEQDQAFNTVDYAGDLVEWQEDYESDLKAITGQAGSIPLLVYQQCAYAPSSAASAATATALESLKAHEENPGKVVLIGPNYPYLRVDGLHLTAHSERSIALIYFEALKKIKSGGTWEPLRPILIERAGAQIDITFIVPVPPLSLDIERVFNPGNYGFSYTDDSSSATISSVAVIAPNKVRITLSGTPTGTNKLIRYGWTKTNWPGGAGPAGPLGSPRGCLRDAGYSGNPYGYQCFNWGVLFVKSVP